EAGRTAACALRARGSPAAEIHLGEPHRRLRRLTRSCANVGVMKSRSDADASYQLVVRGELDERYAYLFEGMQMERTGGTTVLEGSVRDQAQLYGLIERIEELGLELLSVQQAGERGPDERERNDA